MKKNLQLNTTTLLSDEISYEIIKCLAQADAPIIFKGALITKLITKNNIYNIERQTLDLDADWNGELLSINELENYLNSILKKLDGIELKAFRNYDEGKSAGFYVYKNGKNISSFDLDMRKNEYFNVYEIDNINFYGSSIDKIYADKIYVLSSNLIFRRTKDLIDLYILKSIADINVEKINRIYKEKNRPLQDFSTLFYRKDEIEHAYSLLRRVTNKPPFNDVYECCLEIAKKFKNEL